VTSRERIIAAIRFQKPDRCPVFHYIFPGQFWKNGMRVMDLVERYPDDFGNRLVRENAERSERDARKEIDEVRETVDIWGVTYRKLAGYTGGDVIKPAICDWSQWKSYRFPPSPDGKHFRDFSVQTAERKKTEYVMGGIGALFQLMQAIRGPANLLMDIAEDNREVNELADRLVDYMLVRIRGYLAAGADGIGFGDDLGAQDRLLMSPSMWRRFLKPRYARLFAPALEAGKDVWFHSDGWILEIIDDLIGIGVNVLNPQHEIMDTWRVADIVRGRICIRTDLDRQWTIPFGTPERIEFEVKRAIAAFGSRNGGVILHGEVGPEVPFENIEALYSSFYRFGAYPLGWLDEFLAAAGRKPDDAVRR
jgi:uroporphyrinogen decarboxylase